MTSAPRVSIVMPVYRPVTHHLAAALDSVLGQTFQDWELVIVEDPSDRMGTAVLAERVDPRIRHYVNPGRTGVACQHNRAVAASRGEFIARFDADDICEPDRLTKQVELLDQDPAIDVVGSQLTIIDDAGRAIGVRDYPTEHESILRAMHRYNPISGSNVMFRRRVVDTVGGWREDSELPAQDYEWYSRVAQRGFRFANHPERLVRYRRHEGQIKHTRLRGTILTTLEVKRRYWLKSMDAGARLTFLGESVLLALPSRVVLRLLAMIRYR